MSALEAAAGAELDALDAYIKDRGLDAIWAHRLGWKAWAELERGHWDQAAVLEASAAAVRLGLF